MPILLEEKLLDRPIAVIAGDYTPAGEYHVVPRLAESGTWREVMIHHSYRRALTSRGNWQVVEEVDGSRAIEQTIMSDRFPPMLAAGGPSWRAERISLLIRPMTLTGNRGVCFRYRHASDHYIARLADSRLQVVRVGFAEEEVLTEAEIVVDPDSFSLLTIRLTEDHATLAFGDVEISCHIPGPVEGGIALIADRPCRFTSIEVEGDEVDDGALQPDPRVEVSLWKKIRTGTWGSDRNMRVGDINGDGVPELVFARRTDRLGGDNHSIISSLAAFTLDGELLWSFGTPSENAFATTSDLCFQVHDFDGDGVAEVILCKDSELLILDGKTGEITRRMTLPLNPDPGEDKLHRMLGDSLYFADLTGSGRRDCLILKDRYKNLWAYDNDLRELWTWSGNTGHYPYAKDIDGDGREEVMIGHTLLDDDGTVLWSATYPDHSDNVLLVNLDDGSGTKRLRSVIAGSDAGFIVLSEAGEELVKFEIGHGQSMCAANLIPERDGIELLCNTFWGRVGIHVTFDERGRKIAAFEPIPYASVLQPVNWVPFEGEGHPADLAMLSTHPVQGGLMDGHGVRRVMFPDDGHPDLCAAVYDLDGDGIDEILTWNEEEVWIYKASVPGRTPENYPVRGPWCNESNYRAQISIPHTEADLR